MMTNTDTRAALILKRDTRARAIDAALTAHYGRDARVPHGSTIIEFGRPTVDLEGEERIYWFSSGSFLVRRPCNDELRICTSLLEKGLVRDGYDLGLLLTVE